MAAVVNCKGCDYVQVPRLYYVSYRESAERKLSWDGTKNKNLMGAFCTQCGGFIQWVTPTGRYQQVYAFQRGEQAWKFPVPKPWEITRRDQERIAS